MPYETEFTPAQAVTMFCQAAAQKGLIDLEDKDFTVNKVLEILQLDAPEPAASLLPLLRLSALLVQHAVDKGLCEDSPEARDRFSARLFGAVTPGPRAVRNQFSQLLKEEGAQAACDAFYRMCRDNDYIRTERIRENIVYTEPTPAGDLIITINLSKPEKDPKDIAAARRQTASSYPRCMLCRENPGYAGRPGFPARQNHRIIPLTLGGETWYLQYSPYLYYPEHCIVLAGEHLPMQMSRQSFEKMFDFVDLIPHYFIGSNADLPIVGGSILTHDHFQGGQQAFPMDAAEPWFDFHMEDPGIHGQALKWPMTCLKLWGTDRVRLIDRMLQVLVAWRQYSDEELGIFSRTQDAHNAITPVLRKEGDIYTAYLLLRNNRTTAEHPLGLFHPHAQRHHIKKENIGLIEAMGLFILPGRLKEELKQVENSLLSGERLPMDSPHHDWTEEMRARLPKRFSTANAEAFLRKEVAQVCHDVLCDTGVYKQDQEGKAGLVRFLESMGMHG